jgi:hypothetical protein
MDSPLMLRALDDGKTILRAAAVDDEEKTRIVSRVKRALESQDARVTLLDTI